MTTTAAQYQEVAKIIRQQFTLMGLMTLGASNLRVMGAQEGGLAFVARILPFNKSGKRAQAARKMMVTIVLNAMDEYEVEVFYYDKDGNKVVHYENNRQGPDLERFAVALDYDGDTVLNPRYM